MALCSAKVPLIHPNWRRTPPRIMENDFIHSNLFEYKAIDYSLFHPKTAAHGPVAAPL
jgi:hypothetical protein